MLSVLIIACCAVLISMSYVSCNVTDTVINKIERLDKNKSVFNTSIKKSDPSSVLKLKTIKNSEYNKAFKHLKGSRQNTPSIEKKPFNMSQTDNNVNMSFNENINASQHSEQEYQSTTAQQSFPMLKRIHARITHSKDAIWATLTLTFMCVILVLAVAQSRMWKDNYYREAQGIPLPNFNERVLFKDVMERKVKSLKQFFKKKTKKTKENETELEALLPLGEWDV